MICDKCKAEVMGVGDFFLRLCGDSENVRSKIAKSKAEDGDLWNKIEDLRTYNEWLSLVKLGFTLTGKPLPIAVQIACVSDSVPSSQWVN